MLMHALSSATTENFSSCLRKVTKHSIPDQSKSIPAGQVPNKCSNRPHSSLHLLQPRVNRNSTCGLWSMKFWGLAQKHETEAC